MYAIPEKLKAFREAIGLTQFQIAQMLNMEQTTYSKKELAKTKLPFEDTIAIAKIIEKDVTEFTDIPNIINNVTESTLTNSSVNVNGDVNYTNCNTTLPEKIINRLEELVVLFKQHLK